jgi:hypothetical protein
MLIAEEQHERRREPRYPHAEVIGWRFPENEATYRGWVSDKSRSGISFVTPDNPFLSEGEEINLVSGSSLPDRCRVLRIDSYDDTLRIVACQSLLQPVSATRRF